VEEKAQIRYRFSVAETAIVAMLPELELLVGDLRRLHTADGPRGMPPHVTLLAPFADSAEVDGLLVRLRDVFAAFVSFESELRETARFPGLLYLAPQPAQPFVAITEALVEAFPEYPPYGGEFDEIVPHVTVARGDADTLGAIEQDLRGRLPVNVRVERAWLVEDTADGWRRHTAFPLDRRTPA
jgi:2'-5' RNA ligase